MISVRSFTYIGGEIEAHMEEVVDQYSYTARWQSQDSSPRQSGSRGSAPRPELQGPWQGAFLGEDQAQGKFWGEVCPCPDPFPPSQTPSLLPWQAVPQGVWPGRAGGKSEQPRSASVAPLLRTRPGMC